MIASGMKDAADNHFAHRSGRSVRARRRPDNNRQQCSPYGRRESLLSRGELAFYQVLRRAVPPGFTVQVKVRVADVLTCSEKDWYQGHGGKISQKHLDFVICDWRDMHIRLAVELDDRSHDLPHRVRRDRFLNSAFHAARLPLLRVRAKSRYELADLRGELVRYLGSEADPPNLGSGTEIRPIGDALKTMD